jgi:hypothetical protein
MASICLLSWDCLPLCLPVASEMLLRTCRSRSALMSRAPRPWPAKYLHVYSVGADNILAPIVCIRVSLTRPCLHAFPIKSGKMASHTRT